MKYYELAILSEYPISQILHKVFEPNNLRPCYIRKQGNVRTYRVGYAKEDQIQKLLSIDPNLTVIKRGSY